MCPNGVRVKATMVGFNGDRRPYPPLLYMVLRPDVGDKHETRSTVYNTRVRRVSLHKYRVSLSHGVSPFEGYSPTVRISFHCFHILPCILKCKCSTINGMVGEIHSQYYGC